MNDKNYADLVIILHRILISFKDSFEVCSKFLFEFHVKENLEKAILDVVLTELFRLPWEVIPSIFLFWLLMT